jgi:hypothetical protein
MRRSFWRQPPRHSASRCSSSVRPSRARRPEARHRPPQKRAPRRVLIAPWRVGIDDRAQVDVPRVDGVGATASALYRTLSRMLCALVAVAALVAAGRTVIEPLAARQADVLARCHGSGSSASISSTSRATIARSARRSLRLSAPEPGDQIAQLGRDAQPTRQARRAIGRGAKRIQRRNAGMRQRLHDAPP